VWCSNDEDVSPTTLQTADMWINKNTAAAVTYSGLAMTIESASAENSGLQGKKFDSNMQYWCEVKNIFLRKIKCIHILFAKSRIAKLRQKCFVSSSL